MVVGEDMPAAQKKAMGASCPHRRGNRARATGHLDNISSLMLLSGGGTVTSKGVFSALAYLPGSSEVGPLPLMPGPNPGPPPLGTLLPIILVYSGLPGFISPEPLPSPALVLVTM